MPDEIIHDRLQLIIEHAAVIAERVQGVKGKNSFSSSKQDDILVDTLITRQQARSENIKKIPKIDPSFFKTGIPVDVNPIVRFRDLASHHNEKLDPLIIFQICTANLPLIAEAIQTYLEKQK